MSHKNLTFIVSTLARNPKPCGFTVRPGRRGPDFWKPYIPHYSEMSAIVTNEW